MRHDFGNLDQSGRQVRSSRQTRLWQRQMIDVASVLVLGHVLPID